MLVVLSFLVLAFIFIVIDNSHTNKGISSVSFEDCYPDSESNSDITLEFKRRMDKDSTWTKYLGTGDEIQGYIYDAVIKCGNKTDLLDWYLKFDVTKDMYINKAWTGDVEISQVIDGVTRTQRLDLRSQDPGKIYLDMIQAGGEKMIKLNAGDSFIYYPNRKQYEIPMKKYSGVTIGFIFYSTSPDELPDVSTGTFYYKAHKKLVEQTSFKIVTRLFFLWLLGEGFLLGLGWRLKSLERQREKDLATIREVMESFAGFIDAKDKYTNGHSVRVAVYSKEDKYARFRDLADEAYPLNPESGPVDAYLDIPTIIVTGGASGIGKAVVEELLSDGANVVVCDMNPNTPVFENGKEGQMTYVITNVTSAESVNAMVEKTLETYGSIDAIVNNAGINIPRLLVDEGNKYELDEAVWDKVMNVNLKGVFLCAQAAGRVMVKQGKGVIINMSSESGLEGSEGQSVYAASKNAVNSLTRSWAKELGKKNVRVVGVAPGILEATGLRTLAYEEALAYTRGITIDDLRAGYAKTSTTPMGRSGKLSEVANTVAFLCSDRASYIHGVTINVAGGKTRG